MRLILNNGLSLLLLLRLILNKAHLRAEPIQVRAGLILNKAHLRAEPIQVRAGRMRRPSAS
jgi:hypothetical protein